MRAIQVFILILGCCISLTISAKEPIKIDCNKQAACTLLEIKTGKVLIGNLSPTTTIRAINKEIFEIRTSCGSPCSASAYYEQCSGRISETFPDVISLSPDAKRVIFIADRKIMTASVFSTDKKQYEIKTRKPLAETAATFSAIVSATFVSPNSIKLTYLSGSGFKEETETISLDSNTK